MSTTQNKNKKSTDTKPKGEVKTLIPRLKVYSIIIRKRKSKNNYLLFLNTSSIFSNKLGVVVFRFLISPIGLLDLCFLGDLLHEEKRITSFL